MRPNFLIIGAARSGTTALASFLAEHPEVYVTEPKEPHYLALHGTTPAFTGPGDDRMMNSRAVVDRDEWSKLFAPASGRKAGEGSVSTLYYHERSIPVIRTDVDPDAPLFVMLRDPVERAYSSHMYMVSRGYERASFAEALTAEQDRIEAGWHHIWHHRAMGRYSAQLRPFIREFGDRVHVVFHEEFDANPAAHLRVMFGLLGVAPEFGVETTREVNRGGVPKSKVLASTTNFVRRSPRAKAAVKAVIGERLRERIRSANLERPTMDREIRTQLERDFAEEVSDLEDLLGRPTPWVRA